MDLVGASEAAGILGVEVQRISRYRAQGKMPSPVASLAATPVWERSDIVAMREGMLVPEREPIALMGTSEAAAKLGVDKSQIGRWLRGGVFPEPTVRFAAGPVWESAVIEDFAATRL